jgi:hypothetical protein
MQLQQGWSRVLWSREEVVGRWEGAKQGKQSSSSSNMKMGELRCRTGRLRKWWQRRM